MNKEFKNELIQMHLLMERMDKNVIKENVAGRQQVTKDNILDILDSQDDSGNGKFATFIYVNAVDLYATKKNWRADDVQSALDKNKSRSGEQWHQDLTAFNQEGVKGKNPIKYAIVAQKYTVRWTSPAGYAKKYGEYAEKLRNLRMKNGISIESDGMLGDNHNQRTTVDGGEKFSQKGNLMRDFNLAGSPKKPESTWYFLDENGNIITEVPGEVIRSLRALPPKDDPFKSVESYVRKALADNQEALEQYAKEKAEIDASFRGQSFLMDKILAIVATANGTQYYFINDAVATPIAKKSDVNVNPQQLVDIAKEQLDASFEELDDFSQENH